MQYSMTSLPNSRLLLPGDSLVTECNLTFSSSNSMFAITKARTKAITDSWQLRARLQWR